MSCCSWQARLVGVAALLLVGTSGAQAAEKLRVEVRFLPEEGLISDAAFFGNGHLALLYPDAGHIADYTSDGRLFQHTVREAGREKPFRPTFCTAGSGNGLLLFDEYEHKLFFVETDGNISKGVDLAYPTGSGAIALSRIGGLSWTPAASIGDAAGSAKPVMDIWACLPDKHEVAAFDKSGKLVRKLSLQDLLPYPAAQYGRMQWLADGSLYVMDFSQGAVLYRRGAGGAFKRVRAGSAPPPDADAMPSLQDFAVDDQRRMLVATAGPQARLLLLSPDGDGYTSKRVDIGMPAGEHRISVRWSRGKFIIWLKDTPFVAVVSVS